VYIDFDNIVISRYDQVHGRNQFQRDRARTVNLSNKSSDPEVAEKLERATVDIGAVIDFAASFGTIVLTRAYADWSAPVNADYRGQLVGRAVDLVQLFPAAAYAKNGADIRLAVDAVEDMFRLPDLTHVVIVAGDSDYIALAQRCKRLGRFVVGIGVAGSTSKALAAACDEFVTYDALPGIAPIERTQREVEKAPSTKSTAAKPDASESADSVPSEAAADAVEPPKAGKRTPRRAKSAPPPVEEEVEAVPEDPQEVATRLLERALRIGHEKDDSEWLHSSAVKTQIKRMDPSFSEKGLGFRSFSEFLRSRSSVAELDENGTVQLVRLTAASA
jgi:uncharacterized LabA/DUF88 family protein